MTTGLTRRSSQPLAGAHARVKMLFVNREEPRFLQRWLSSVSLGSAAAWLASREQKVTK